MWIIMTLWLGLVAASAVLAFKKWQKTDGFFKKQMFYVWLGGTFVFIGDLLHTIGYTISAYTNSTTGLIELFARPFESRTFSLFFDGLVFMVYYTLWAFFIVARYQQGQFNNRDKTTVGLAIGAIVLILPGAIPNAFGIYTLQYDIAIWSPHIILFLIFGVMTVWKLIRCSMHASTQTSDGIIKVQEQALHTIGTSLLFSFLFFILTLALLPFNEMFGLFMIPKTVTYMVAFIYLIKGVILPTPQAQAATR
jgi:hypothetical protein